MCTYPSRNTYRECVQCSSLDQNINYKRHKGKLDKEPYRLAVSAGDQTHVDRAAGLSGLLGPARPQCTAEVSVTTDHAAKTATAHWKHLLGRNYSIRKKRKKNTNQYKQ